MGDPASACPDAYLFTVTNWAKHVGVDLSKFANVGAFMERMAARPAVQAALEAEGLVKGCVMTTAASSLSRLPKPRWRRGTR